MKCKLLSAPVERISASAQILTAIALAVVLSRSANAAEQAVGVLLVQQGSGGVFHYNIDLKNSGPTNIGTLWYSWVPGADFLGASPTNLASPPGWTAQVTHVGAGDGFAVQWVNNTGPLAPGKTLSGFTFDSTDTPATLTGNSSLFTSSPLSTSFIYVGAPETDAGFQFNINPATHLWQNPFSPLDVNDDGTVSHADGDLVVSALISAGVRTLGVPTASSTLPRFVDTSGNGVLSPFDLLGVIDHLAVDSALPTAAPASAALRAVAVRVTAVPEPNSAALLLSAGAILAAAWLRNRRAASGDPIIPSSKPATGPAA